jgi:succinate-semialdehyde dehydrogenase/glutarate-semialdehyde dehydrogenase
MAKDALPGRTPTRILVGGEWIGSALELEVIDPASLEWLASTADAGAAEAAQAVDAAADALPLWSGMAPRDRAEVLRRTYELMIEEIDDCARLISLENGKAYRDAVAEARYAAEFFRWFSEEAVRIGGEFRSSPTGDKTIITSHRPRGVAYLITPWNFPAAMATRKIAPALAAGCTTVLKPAPQTPLTALWVGDVLTRAGAPAGVVNILPTSRAAEVSDVVMSDRRVGALSFTGSTAVGKHLLARAAERALPASMELGGNAPFLVLQDADVEEAVAGAMVAKMRNGGAACTAANRFYVHASLAEDFARSFRAALSELRVGPGIDPTNDLGAMVSAEERDKMMRLLAEAEAAGAAVDAVSTVPSQGAFVAPSIVTDVQHGSDLTRNEIFGPIAPIVSFEDEDEAIRMANDTDSGLIAYLYSRDRGRALGIAPRLESGMVAINRGVISDPAAPFGGMKESGLGREGGFHGVHEFLEVQYIGVTL